MPDAIAVVDVDPEVASLLQDRRHRGDAECRRRAASFRLERLLVLPVPERAASACRAALSRGAGPALLAHPHPRHQARSEEAQDRQGDRAARRWPSKAGYTRPHTVHCGPEGIYVAALGNREGKGPGGIFLMDHETFDVLGQMGDRPRAAAARLRRLVASRPRHPGHQRVGHARHLRERPRSRRCCSAASTAAGCTSGTCTSASTCRPSTSATSTSSCSSCGPRTTRPRPTASSIA